jgi:hypothetical protein
LTQPPRIFTLLKIVMKFTTLAIQALATMGVWSVAGASKSPILGPRLGAASDGAAAKEDRLVELANAITVLQDAGIDVADLGWGKKPQPEEQLIGSPLSVGVAGVDVEGLSGPELAFLEDALQFFFSQEADGDALAATKDGEGSSSSSSSSNLGRRSPTWTFWHTSYNMRCRMCRDERFLGASVVESSSPLIVAWEDKLQHVLLTSGFDAFAGVTDVDIHIGSGIVAAFAAAAEAAAAVMASA